MCKLPDVNQPQLVKLERGGVAIPIGIDTLLQRMEIDSNVPWIGFPVAYAVSGVLLTIFGYFSMVLAQ